METNRSTFHVHKYGIFTSTRRYREQFVQVLCYRWSSNSKLQYERRLGLRLAPFDIIYAWFVSFGFACIFGMSEGTALQVLFDLVLLVDLQTSMELSSIFPGCSSELRVWLEHDGQLSLRYAYCCSCDGGFRVYDVTIQQKGSGFY